MNQGGNRGEHTCEVALLDLSRPSQAPNCQVRYLSQVYWMLHVILKVGLDFSHAPRVRLSHNKMNVLVVQQVDRLQHQQHLRSVAT